VDNEGSIEAKEKVGVLEKVATSGGRNRKHSEGDWNGDAANWKERKWSGKIETGWKKLERMEGREVKREKVKREKGRKRGK